MRANASQKSVLLSHTCQLVDLFEQLLDVIFNLFDLSGVGALTLTINRKCHITTT